MKRLSSCAALLCLGVTLMPVEAASHWKASRSSSKGTTPQATGSSGAATARKSVAATTPARKAPIYIWRNAKRTGTTASQVSAARATHAVTPASPSADRYREIQQALVDKGYYKGTVDGTWNQESQEALRRFQTDQSLTGTGKLDSLSLIALGLGPSRDNSSAVSTAAASAAAASAGMTR